MKRFGLIKCDLLDCAKSFKVLLGQMCILISKKDNLLFW